MHLFADLFLVFSKKFTISLTFYKKAQYVYGKGQNFNNENLRREKYEKIKENRQRLYQH